MLDKLQQKLVNPEVLADLQDTMSQYALSIETSVYQHKHWLAVS